MIDFIMDRLEWIVGLLLAFVLWMGRKVMGMRDDLKDLKAWKESHEKEWVEYRDDMSLKINGMNDKVTDIWKALAKGEVLHDQHS